MPRDFTRNIQSFGSSSICVVCDINKTGTRALKLATNLNTNYLFGCWLCISSGDGLHLWLLGALVYLTLFGIDTVEISWCVNWITRHFTRNIQSFGSSLIYVVCNIDETGKRNLKLASKWKTTYLLGCWLCISSGDCLHLWLLGILVYLTLFGIDTVEIIWCVNWIIRHFTSNIQSFGSSLICVVCNIDETGKRNLKLASKWKTNYLLGCWLRISYGDCLHLWLLGILVYLNLLGI